MIFFSIDDTILWTAKDLIFETFLDYLAALLSIALITDARMVTKVLLPRDMNSLASKLLNENIESSTFFSFSLYGISGAMVLTANR